MVWIAAEVGRTRRKRRSSTKIFIVVSACSAFVLAARHTATTFAALAGSKASGVDGSLQLGTMLESKLRNNELQVLSSDMYTYVVTQNKGMNKGEDIIVTAGSNGQYSVSLLMDGHGGQETVKYAGQHFQRAILEACKSSTSMAPEAWKTLVQSTFVNFQNEIRQKRLKAGATAIATFTDLKTGSVSFAWCGDSSAIIARKGDVHFRTSKHQLDNVPELARIRRDVPDTNYFIEDPYLCNPQGHCVMPTRGIGDLDMEVAGFISVPEVSDFMPLEPGDIIVVASDGVWDVLDDKGVAAQLKNCQLEKYSIKDMGTEMVRYAVHEWTRQYGHPSQTDDVSLIIYETPQDGSPKLPR